MRKSYVYQHEKAGELTIYVDGRAKSYIGKSKEGRIQVTVPPFFTYEKLNDFIDKLIERFEQMGIVQEQRIIDENFHLDTPGISIRGQRTRERHSTIRIEENTIYIHFKANQDVRSESFQRGLIKTLEKTMRNWGNTNLLPALRQLANQHNIRFRDAKFATALHHAWGKCSTMGMITLSPYLILLPHELIEYVMLHELAHIKYMSHNDEFWNHLNTLCQGKALELDRSLKSFNTSITHLIKG